MTCLRKKRQNDCAGIYVGIFQMENNKVYKILQCEVSFFKKKTPLLKIKARE